jgi:hypothetical protein
MSAENFEQKLRASLASVRMEPRSETWAAVESQLTAQRGRKRRGVIWLWTGGSIAVAACLLAWMWLSRPALSTFEPAGVALAEERPAPDQNQSPVEKPTHVPGDMAAANEVVEGQAGADYAASAQRFVEDQPVKGSVVQNQVEAQVEAQAQIQIQIQEERWLTQEVPMEQSTVAETKPLGLQKGMPLVTLAGPEDLERWNQTGVRHFTAPWWEILPAPDQEEERPLFAFHVQAGQDATREAPTLGLTSDMEVVPDALSDFSGQDEGLNGDPLQEADFVRFANAQTNTENSATLVDYPSLESRFRLSAEYRITPKLGIVSGLGLSISNRGIINQGSFSFEETSISQMPVGAWSYTDEFDYRNYQLEIPVELAWHFYQGKGDWVLAPGLSFNYNLNLLDSKQEERADDQFNGRVLYATTNTDILAAPTGSEGTALAYRQWNSFASLSLQYQRSIGPGLVLFGGPSFKYQVGDIFAGSLSEQQASMRLGALAGIKFGR